MKRNILKQALFIFSAIFLYSCEGPEGPIGPEGLAGADGVDANETCVECHNNTTEATVTADWTASSHGLGGAVAYAGSRNGCAKCHSHEGFVETVHTGRDTIAENILIPTEIGCKTCHDFHQTLDQENEGPDYALRTGNPVTLLIDPEGSAVDIGAQSNLCLNCHQPRRSYPEADASGNFYVSSTHYGPHHGPQGTILVGKGMFGFGNTLATSTQKHSCTKCHMEFPVEEGNPSSHKWVASINDCAECHGSDMEDVQTEVKTKLDALATKLITAGLLAEEDGSYHPVVGTFTQVQAAALYNFLTVYEDRSLGVHNPAYVKDALDKSLAAF